MKLGLVLRLGLEKNIKRVGELIVTVDFLSDLHLLYSFLFRVRVRVRVRVSVDWYLNSNWVNIVT
jgi:hypothetical protein